jgi:hypothetical protein
VGIRTGENARESWWVRNLTKKTIAIGDLLLVPAIKPGKQVDVLRFYSREKISHSKVLVKLVKAGIVSLDKEKDFTNDFPGMITSATIDEAITPAEENEVGGGSDFDYNVVTEVGDPGSDDNLVTEQGIREALIDEVTEGEEIDDDTEGILLFGEDPNDEAQPLGISGDENNEILTMDLDLKTLLEDILVELIKANIQMAIVTGNEIKNTDIDSNQEN